LAGSKPAEWLLYSDTLHLATLWKLTRRDGAGLRITDHDKEILFDGETYTPVTGVDTSARQKIADLSANNQELVGVISDDRITDADLRAKRYHGATLEEMLVDWTNPASGAIRRSRYFLTEISYDGDQWKAQVGGLGVILAQSVGGQYTRHCRWSLGDSMCRVNLAALSVTGSVGTVRVPRRTFESTELASAADGAYSLGVLDWTGGANEGQRSMVKLSVHGTGLVELYEQTVYPVEQGDTFSVAPGCDRTHTTCKERFNNLLNFGGFPTIPGTNKAQQTPDV